MSKQITLTSKHNIKQRKVFSVLGILKVIIVVVYNTSLSSLQMFFSFK